MNVDISVAPIGIVRPTARAGSALADAAGIGLLALFVFELTRPVLNTAFEPPSAAGWSVICAAFAIPVLLIAWMTRRHWSVTPVDVAIGAYLLCVLATWPASLDRARTAAAIVTLAADVAVFYAVRVLSAERPALGRLMTAAFVIACALLMWRATDYHVRFGLGVRLVEYPGLEWNGRQGLGVLAAMQFAMVVGVWQTARTRLARLSALCLLAAAAVELLFLYSRTSWTAAATVLVVAAIVSMKFGRLRGWVATVAVIAATVAVVRTPNVATLVRTAVGAEHGPEGGIELRAAAWKYTTAIVGAHPFAGIGLDNFVTMHQKVYKGPMPEVFLDDLADPTLRTGPVHPHNLYLQQAAEVGVIGGLAYAAIWALALWLGWRAAIRDAGWNGTLALFYAVAAIAVVNIGENMFLDAVAVERVRVHTIAWVVLALVVEGWAHGDRGAGARPQASDSAAARWPIAAVCLGAFIYSFWTVFVRETPTVAIEGQHVGLAEAFGRGVPVAQTFEMGGGLDAIDVQFSAEPASTLLVRCDILMIDPAHLEHQFPLSTSWLTIKDVGRRSWRRLAIPPRADTSPMVYMLRMQLVSSVPAAGGTAVPVSAVVAAGVGPRVGVAVSEDNVLGGGLSWVGKDRQRGSVSLQAYSHARTVYARVRHAIEPMLPRRLQSLSVLIGMAVYEAAFAVVIYALLTGSMRPVAHDAMSARDALVV